MVIDQGDVFWVELEEGSGSEPGMRYPHVVVQNNVFNQSRMDTVLVCPLTSNLKRAEAPGNVLLEAGEANVPKQSVVTVAQIYAVRKADLVEKIGRLSPRRIRQILSGVMLVIAPREVDSPAFGGVWEGQPGTTRVGGE
jgi:mRNA interferase MazF